MSRVRASAAAYALLLFGVFSYFMSAATWSPVSRLGLTRAIVERGSVDVDPWADATGDRAQHAGHWYSDKAPVPSWLAVPPYFVLHEWDILHGTSPQFASLSTPDRPARHLIVNDSFTRSLYVCSIATAAVSGVAVGLLLLVWLRRRFSEGTALASSAITMLATPLWPYATSFYGHLVAAAFLLVAFVWLTRPAPGRWATRGAGLALALACGCEYVVAVPVAVLIIAALVRAKSGAPRLMLDLALGALAPAVALGLYHTACFGSPFATGYSNLPRPEFAAGHAQGLLGISLPRPSALAGLLVGPRRGLFLLAPVTVIGAVGLGARAVKGDFDERTAAMITLTLFLANAGYYMWWGGAATGPRHLVPVLPFLALGVARAWQHRILRWVVIAAAAVSFANMLAFTAVGLEAPEHGSALDYAWRGLFTRRIAHLTGASNLGLRMGLPRELSLAPLLLWLALGLRYLGGAIAPAQATATGHSFVDGMSSMASPDLPSCAPTASSPDVSAPGPSASDESSSVPNTLSSPEQATKVLPASASSASTSTPRGEPET